MLPPLTATAISLLLIPALYPSELSRTPMANSPSCPSLLSSSLPSRRRLLPSRRRLLPSLPFLTPRRRPLLSHRPPSSLFSSRTKTISTSPLPHPPPTDLSTASEITRLNALRSRLKSSPTLQSKLRVLDADSRVRDFFSRPLRDLNCVAPFEIFLLKCLVAAGQVHVLEGVEELEVTRAERSGLRSALYVLADLVEKWSLDGSGGGGDGGGMEGLKRLVGVLAEVERFYDCIGGIIGYQIMVLDLILPSNADKQIGSWTPHLYGTGNPIVELHVPSGLDLHENIECASQAALWGIEGLPELGEIYPLGGAGDRLGLVDSETGKCLPAALLPYCGRTLLEGLIRDLQAREFLYFKIYGKQCITPVAIMTSSVKNNHGHITALCERFGWFGRGRENFRLFEQPLVPVVSAPDGQWLTSGPLSLVCKPGGHGAIWKLAHDKGIFQWFYCHGRKGATVRQVSNVVAATDVTLLALAGLGLQHKKKLGFASCQRNFGATEGINVLIEKRDLDGNWEYGITCIEYTEFEKYGIRDAPSLGSLHSGFPANTNILYVDLPSAEKIGSSQNATCLPGMVLNLKKPVSYVDHQGLEHSVSGGRLECTMQNIADNFMNSYTSRCNKDIEGTLDTFIVHNERKRVTSSAKRKRKKTDSSLHQTPDGSLLDVIRNAFDLLSYCNIEIPKIGDNNTYLDSAPPFLIFLHPALGPLWEVTRQKFSGGSISEGSELQIEVAEFLWRDVKLEGSLVVIAENIMGSIKTNKNSEPTLLYGQRCGRCRLQNVKVLNRGIDWSSVNNVYWKHDVNRFEMLKIVLHGNAEFEASDVTLQGNHVFEVPDGYRMRIISDSQDFSVKLDPIAEGNMDNGSWFWKYKLKGTHIYLEMVEM